MTISQAFPRSGHRLLLSLLSLLLLFRVTDAGADVTLPPRILDPLSAAEAWNVIRLATGNVERLLEEERPLEIAEQISLCSPALRVLARTGQASSADDAFTRAYRSVNLMAKESMAENLIGARSVYAELEKSLRELEAGFDAEVVKGEILSCPDHPDVLSTEAEATCDRCGRKMLPRRIPYSFIYVKPGIPTVTLTARSEALLRKGEDARVRLRLQTLDGRPLILSDLEVMHTLPIHVFVAGPGRRDCQFPALEASGTAGEYAFSFTTALAGPYRVWAGVVPFDTGLQEYPTAELPGESEEEEASDEAAANGKEIHTATADGVRFQVSIASGGGFKARAGRLQRIVLSVSDADGDPVRRLEPFMNAFAHLTGFYPEDDTVLQLHPTGGDILREDLRGGPNLAFKFYAPRSGLLRLYCRVRIDGKNVVVPFVLNVLE